MTSEPIDEQLFRSSYAIAIDPESSKTGLTIWENGTAATIELDQDQLAHMVEALSHSRRSRMKNSNHKSESGEAITAAVDVQKDGAKMYGPIDLHAIASIADGFSKIDHGCYAIIRTLSDEGKSNTRLFKQIVGIREMAERLGKTLNPSVFL